MFTIQRIVLCAMTVVLTILPNFHTLAAEFPAEVLTMLDRYRAGWESKNPFALLQLAPEGSQLFVPLLDNERFDQLAQVQVSLRDVEVSSGEDGTTIVQVTKVQEDLYHVGTISRGISRIELTLKTTSHGFFIVNHRMLGPPEWEKENPFYLSSNPRTWEDPVPVVERKFYEAVEHVIEGNFEQARDILTNLFDARSDAKELDSIHFELGTELFHAQALYLLGLCHHFLNDASEARARNRAALELHPSFPLALNSQADDTVAQGQLAEAIRSWKKSLSIYPGQPEVRDKLEFYQNAMRYYPSSAQRALYTSTAGIPLSQAAEVLTELLVLDKHNPETRRRLAAVHLLNYDAQNAERVLLENEYHHPTDLETQYLLGRTYLAMGRFDDALTYFIRVWSSSPDYRDTLVYLSEINALNRRHRNALTYLKEALRNRPDDPILLYKAGVYALRLGRKFEGMGYLRKARDSRPPESVRRDLYNRLMEL